MQYHEDPENKIKSRKARYQEYPKKQIEHQLFAFNGLKNLDSSPLKNT